MYIYPRYFSEDKKGEVDPVAVLTIDHVRTLCDGEAVAERDRGKYRVALQYDTEHAVALERWFKRINWRGFRFPPLLPLGEQRELERGEGLWYSFTQRNLLAFDREEWWNQRAASTRHICPFRDWEDKEGRIKHFPRGKVRRCGAILSYRSFTGDLVFVCEVVRTARGKFRGETNYRSFRASELEKLAQRMSKWGAREDDVLALGEFLEKLM